MSILILQEFIKEFGVKADKRFLGQAGGRLAAGRSHRRVTAGTPARRGLLFYEEK